MQKSTKRQKRPKKKTGRPSKKQIYLLHLIGRFKRRFGIILTEADVKYMMRQIREGTALLLKDKQFRERTMWEVNLRENRFTIIYDKKAKMVVTVYPRGEEDKDESNNNNHTVCSHKNSV